MRTVRCLVCSFRLTRVHDDSVLSRNCALDTVPQAASPQPRTPTRKARPGLHLEVSSATRAPRNYRKRGASGGDNDGDAESDRIKILSETFVGSRGRLHNVTMLYVQEDINESFADSEHMAVALMCNVVGKWRGQDREGLQDQERVLDARQRIRRYGCANGRTICSACINIC